MTIDTKFLDLFWFISGQNAGDKQGACEKLLKSLTSKDGKPKLQYLDYTRERLIKGLKSFSSDARNGYFEALVPIYNRFPDQSTKTETMNLLSKHIYTASTSKNEESSMKYAYLLCAEFVCKCHIIEELDTSEVKTIADPLIKLLNSTNWQSEALRVSTILLRKLPPKVVQKVFQKSIEQTWKALQSSDSSSIGEQLMFLIAAKNKLKSLVIDGKPALLDFSDKALRKKFLTGVLSISEKLVPSLIDEAIEQNILREIWPKICSSLCSSDATRKHRQNLISIISHVVRMHGDDITRLTLTESVSRTIMHQLSDVNLACFQFASNNMKDCLESVTKAWNHSANANTAGKTTDETETVQTGINAASPNTLFSCLVMSNPLCDAVCHIVQRRPCRYLLEHVPQAIETTTLFSYAKQLMDIFFNPQQNSMQSEDIQSDEHASAARSLQTRLFITSQLQHVAQCILSKPPAKACEKLLNEILDFFVMVGLNKNFAAIKSKKLQQPIVPRESESAWVALFRFIEFTFKRPSSAKLHGVSQSLSSVFSQINVTVLDRLALAEPSVAEALNIHAKQGDSLLRKNSTEDALGFSMASLYCVSCLVALSQEKDAHSQIFSLLDDLAECCRRRRKQARRQSITPNEDDVNSPAWTAVLTDVILGLLSLPSHLLRTFAGNTFQHLVNSGLAGSDCLQLIYDLMQTRVTEPESVKDDEDSDEEGEEEADGPLISFPTGLEESEDVAMEEQDEEEVEADSNAEESNEETGDEKESEEDDEEDEEKGDDEEDGSQSDSSASEESEVDETQIEQLRTRVRDALGPAAIADEDVDSSSSLLPECTDAEMFAQDEALAAAFRATRLAAPKRRTAEQARVVGQMKMRCLDLLQCILQYSNQPSLLFPTLTQLLNLAHAACVSEWKLKLKERKKQSDQADPSNPTAATNNPRPNTSFTARYGDLPQFSRIAEAVQRIQSRPNSLQQSLTAAILESPKESATEIEQLMLVLVTVAKLEQPPVEFAKLLTTVAQFTYRATMPLSKTQTNFGETLSEGFLKELSIFLETSRKASIHRNIFFAILGQCSQLAIHASPLLSDAFNRLFDQHLVTGNTSEGSFKGSAQFACIQCCDTLTAVCRSLVQSHYEEAANPKLMALPRAILARVIPVLVKSDDEANAPWLASVALTESFLNLLTWCIKATNKQKSDSLTIEPAFLDRLRESLSTLPKRVRKPVHRFSDFLHEVNRQTGKTTTDEVRQAQLTAKKERKDARRAKRQERQLERQEKMKDATGKTNPQKVSNKSQPKLIKTHKKPTTSGGDVDRKSSQPVKPVPKPKEMKAPKRKMKTKPDQQAATKQSKVVPPT